MERGERENGSNLPVVCTSREKDSKRTGTDETSGLPLPKYRTQALPSRKTREVKEAESRSMPRSKDISSLSPNPHLQLLFRRISIAARQRRKRPQVAAHSERRISPTSTTAGANSLLCSRRNPVNRRRGCHRRRGGRHPRCPRAGAREDEGGFPPGGAAGAVGVLSDGDQARSGGGAAEGEVGCRDEPCQTEQVDEARGGLLQREPSPVAVVVPTASGRVGSSEAPSG